MNCLPEPELFLFLSRIDWLEITLVAKQTANVLTADALFQWVYVDPMGEWCFFGDISGRPG